MVSSNVVRKTKIFVGRLPENCRNEELRQLFVRFGEVTECDVMNRYGFVHMAREEDAAAAIKALHNTTFKGATINVEQSTGKARGPGGRRDDRRGGPMRGGRGGRDGGRDSRPGPYNDRRAMPMQSYYSTSGGGSSGGYSDYGSRGMSDYGGRDGSDYSTGYSDRMAYGQGVGSSSMGYASSSAPPMSGGYSTSSSVGGYTTTGAADYSRGADYGRPDFDYGRSDSFSSGRPMDYGVRNDYDRAALGPMRNGAGGPGPASGSMTPGGYTSGYSEAPYDGGSHWYGDGYDRSDPYGPPRGSSAGSGGRYPAG